MVTNERQYRITKATAEKCRASIAEAQQSPPRKGVHPLIHKAGIDAMIIQAEDLERQVKVYEDLKAGKMKLEGKGEELGALLVLARTARGFTQAQLAERLGLHKQKIQQYEATEYESASLTRVNEVLQALGIVSTVSVRLLEVPDLDAALGTSAAANTARAAIAGQWRKTLTPMAPAKVKAGKKR